MYKKAEIKNIEIILKLYKEDKSTKFRGIFFDLCLPVVAVVSLAA